MPDIIVNDINPRVQYTAAGGQTVFAYAFPIFANTDIKVYQRAAGTTANDSTQILILTTNYTVTNNVAPAVGGTITLNVGATVGDIVTLVRDMPDDRLNNYLDGGLWSATQFNTDFDRTVLMAQQNKMYDIRVTPHYNLNDVINSNASAITAGVDLFLPILPALCSWRKNAANTAIEAFAMLPAGSGAILPTIVNNVAKFADTAGTVQNSGISVDAAGNMTQTAAPLIAYGSQSKIQVAQAGHGLAAGNVVYLNGANYAAAIASGAATAETVGIVTAVADANNFTLQFGGLVTEALVGLVAGTVYFLDPAVAGGLTAVRPVVPGQVAKPFLIARSATSGFITNQLGVII